MKIPKGFEPKKRKWPDRGGGNGRILPFGGLEFAEFYHSPVQGFGNEHCPLFPTRAIIFLGECSKIQGKTF